IVEGRKHYDRAMALYDPAENRSLATRFGQDVGVSILSFRSYALWMLGYPEAALADAREALKDAREIGHVGTLMYALNQTAFTHIFCGNYATANAQLDEVVALADEKGALYWKALGIALQGWVLALSGKASDAVHVIASGITAMRSTGAKIFVPLHLSHSTGAYAELGQVDDAWRCIREAMKMIEAAKERVWEAEVNRVAGQMALKLPKPDAAKAEKHFERA